MKIKLKIPGHTLDWVRNDLRRRHEFAHERVGFLTAGAAADGGDLLLSVRSYQPVADEDYERSYGVGAQIGSNAMRKAAQAAYRPPSALLHVHTHGGRGVPAFSSVDLESAREFVPGFFQSCPRMPHGLLVLSDTAATGLLWLRPDAVPIEIDQFVRVDRPIVKQWSGSHELA